MNESPTTLQRISPLAVRLVALWLLSGALFKLLSGSPNDLPGPVREMFETLGVATTFKLAISIELAIAFSALLMPRPSWVLLVLQMLVFLGVLAPLVIAGEASCGCFGSKVPITPQTMMAIDGVLLAAMLATRPWSSLRPAPKALKTILVPLLIAGVIAPWWHIRTGVSRPDAGKSTSAEGGNGAGAEPAVWSLPDPLPRFESLDPETWVGQPVNETQLHVWTDTDLLLPDATWVLWREDCDHCAEHLRELADAYDASAFYVLIQLRGAGGDPVVDLKPPAAMEIALPLEVDFVIQTPWEVVVEAGVVTSALTPETE